MRAKKGSAAPLPWLRAGGAHATCVVVCVALTLGTSIAHAYQEPNTMSTGECLTCHAMVFDGSSYVIVDNPAGGDCVACHGAAADSSQAGVGYTAGENSGPHGGYTTLTRKCATCHSAHAAPSDSVLLLPAATIVGTCETCHDGTGGWGVYGAIEARGGSVGGGHSVETTNLIPGGDPNTGSESVGSFSGAGGTLICTDCHSPHGADTVAAFLGERRRIRQGTPPPVSTRLLRRQPTGASVPVNEYGSDWCLACHAGRASGGMVENHPVESAQSWPEEDTRFVYDRLAVLDGADTTHATVAGRLGGSAADEHLHHQYTTLDENGDPVPGFANTEGNRGYLMPWPRSGDQQGHAPVCQQCHEDSRELGDLASDGAGQAAPFIPVYADAVVWNGSSWETATSGTVNPAFQNFPHETENPYMVIERADDLCLNCHPISQLP